MRREGNTLSPLLRSAWDAQVLEVLTRGKSKLRASDALVSVVAHITPEELEKLLGKSVEVTNGFVNRFLWGCVRRSKLLPEGRRPASWTPSSSPCGRLWRMPRQSVESSGTPSPRRCGPPNTKSCRVPGLVRSGWRRGAPTLKPCVSPRSMPC